MSKFMSSRKVQDMHPLLQHLWLQFDALMKQNNIDYIITCTYRNDDDQNKLYASGRAERGPIVTHAKAGESAHNVCSEDAPCACAFDIVILTNGKPDWSTTNINWKRAGVFGQQCGLEWAGTWNTFREFPHFQLPNWSDYK